MGLEGKKDQVQGRAEEAAGDLTGNQDMQAKGEGHQTEGKAKEAVDSAKEKLNDGIDKLSDKANNH